MTDNMNNMNGPIELLDRAKELAQGQSVLIETLLQRCKDLTNDVEILRGTIRETVAQRNEALAKFVEAERRADEMEGKAGEWIAMDFHKERIAAIRSEHNKVLAELSDMKEQNARLRAHVDGLMGKDGRTYCIKVEAERDRALAASKHWEAEKEMAYGKLLKAEDELAAMKERAEMAEVESTEHRKSAANLCGRGIALQEQRDAARAEADALRVEVAKLKARKVKLPEKYKDFGSWDGVPKDVQEAWKRHDDAVDACADAIRAAGVEVEL